MSSSLDQKLQSLKSELEQVKAVTKEAFMAAPPMPQGGMGGGAMPPMDPAAMQGMGPAPMDPAMAGDMAPPMDPSMMQGMPMDPSMMQGMPMDRAAGGMAPPSMDPEMLDQVLGILEEMGHEMAKAQQERDALAQQVEELAGQMDDLSSRFANVRLPGPDQLR